MLKAHDLLLGMLYFLIGHFFVFYQLNGQFIWKSFVKYEWLVAAGGFFISFMFIWGTKNVVSGMDGVFWPARFIGFGIGTLIYAMLVNYHFSEGINLKTGISLLLSAILIAIQVLWKVDNV